MCYPVGPRRGVAHSTGPVRATTRPVGLPASLRDGLLPSPSAGVDPCWSIILGLLGHGVVLSAQDVVVYWRYFPTCCSKFISFDMDWWYYFDCELGKSS